MIMDRMCRRCGAAHGTSIQSEGEIVHTKVEEPREAPGACEDPLPEPHAVRSFVCAQVGHRDAGL